MMEKGKDQIPDDGFLMTKMPMYLIVTVYPIVVRSTSTLAYSNPNPNLNPNPKHSPNPNPNLNPYPNPNPKPNPFVVISAW